MSLSIHLPRAAACGLIAAGVLATTAMSAQAVATTAPVSAAKLSVWSASGGDGAYIGQLRYRQRFAVERYSADGRWAYGKARGQVDRAGWVRAVGLKGLRPDRPTPLRICAKSEDVTGQAAGLPVIGTLEKGDRFSVIRFSGRGREAYGIARGDVDKRGWIDSSALCQF